MTTARRPPISRARGDAAATRSGPAAKGERGTGFPRAAAGPPLHRQRSQIRLCRSAPLPRDFGPGRSAAASTLGRRCAARWASPFAPAGRWLREDCGQDPHRWSLMASGRDDGGGSRQDRSRPHLPRREVLGLVLWAQSAADFRPPRAPASAPDTAAAGKDPWIRRAVTGELPGPHAPSALLELSSLDPGLGARAQGERRAASIARGSRRTRSKKRSGCITRQCWSSRLSRPDVCEGTLSVSVPVSYMENRYDDLTGGVRRGPGAMRISQEAKPNF